MSAGPDEFDRTIAWALEAERREKAERPLAQYARGLLGLDELISRLIQVLEDSAFQEDLS